MIQVDAFGFKELGDFGKGACKVVNSVNAFVSLAIWILFNDSGNGDGRSWHNLKVVLVLLYVERLAR